MKIEIDQTELKEFISKIIEEKTAFLLKEIKALLPDKEEKYYSVKDVARICGLSISTVYKYVYNKELFSRKFNRQVIIHPSALEEFLDKRPKLKGYEIKERKKFRKGKLIQQNN